MRRVNGKNIKQLVRDLANGIECALGLMVKDELSTTDAKFLVDFRKFSKDHLSNKGINIFNSIKLTLEYYYESDRNMITDNTKGNPKFIHGIEKFLLQFKSLYKEKKSLVVDYCAFF